MVCNDTLEVARCQGSLFDNTVNVVGKVHYRVRSKNDSVLARKIPGIRLRVLRASQLPSDPPSQF